VTINGEWRMTTRARRWWLFAHVVSSVGWIGVELSLLALGLVGKLASDPTVVRSCYVVAGVLGDIFYFPAAAIALVSGLVLGLGTKWGLVRYRWVALKLVINVVLLIGGSLMVIPVFASASEAAVRGDPVGKTTIMLVTAMTAGLALLLVATGVSVFKPWSRLLQRNARASARL
jgi:hypothetical protein